MLVFLIFGIIGILNGLYLEFALSMVLYFLIFLFLFLVFKKRKSEILISMCFLIGFNVYTSNLVNCYDYKYLDKSIIEDEFEIISHRDVKEYYDKYIVKSSKKDKFILYLPHGNELKKGTKINLSGEFGLPDLSRNTGGFNYRRYLNSQKIYGIIRSEEYYISDLENFNLIYYIQDEIYQSFSKLFPKNEMGLIMGMMIGETKDISEDVLENFKVTGITHLIAVSGSNVVYVVTLVQFIFKKFFGKRNTYFISILFLIIFMLISGASASVCRATIMIILSICADIFFMKSDTFSNILTSAIILVFINPLVIYDVGFILSFGGTLGIVWLSKDFTILFKRLGKLSETLGVTCSAQPMLSPIMMYYFNTLSILSIFTNIIVVPISGSITILGFVIFIISKIYFPIAKLLSGTLYVLASFTIWVAETFSKLPFALIKTITPNIFEMALFYFVVFYFANVKKVKHYRFISTPFKLSNHDGTNNISMIIRKIKPRILIFFVIIFVFIEIICYKFPRNYLDIRGIDVGQGDAILVETDTRKFILVDGGGSENYDVGENVLLPYLLNRRVLHIDTIFSSHSDADHLNGIITVLENLKVNNIVIGKNALGYDSVYEIASKKNIKIIEVQNGDLLQIGNVKFEIISPNINLDNNNVNDYSLVFKLVFGEKSMLFTGDISSNAEEALYNVKSDILKVAHHGSKYSSSEKFLQKVKPSVSLIEVGKDNGYGHPDKEVLKRLERFSKVYTTAEYGEIGIKLYQNSIKVFKTNNFASQK